MTNPAEQSHYAVAPPVGPPPQLRYQPQPGYPAYADYPPEAARTAKGFMGSLFDYNFDNFIAPKLVKAIYIVLVIVVSFGAAIMALGSIAAMTSGGAGVLLGLLGLVMAPVLWLLGLMVYRVSLELMIVTFKISEDLRAIRTGSGA